MRHGADRSNVDYVWPKTLVQPPRPPLLVYLDLNHWISFAKAVAGHSEGKPFLALFEACLSAARERKAVFPLSDTIYYEVNKIRNHRQRRDLRLAMEPLSKYLVVTSRPTIARHEIEALLDDVVGQSDSALNTISYLDWGVARAFGFVGGFRVVSGEQGQDVTEQVRQSFPEGPEAFDAVLAEAELSLNRSMIEGPTPEEEPELRKLGWNPEGTIEIAEKRAQQEREQAQRLNDYEVGSLADGHGPRRWRRGRIRDVVAAREVSLELIDFITESVMRRNTSIGTIFQDKDSVRRFGDSMPSTDVAVTIKTALHRNQEHRWAPNDISDIDALGSTIPYCDVVVSDSAMVAIATDTGLAERLNTSVLSDLIELESHIG